MAEALGAKYTLTKPLDPELLIDAVERALADMDAHIGGEDEAVAG